MRGYIAILICLFPLAVPAQEANFEEGFSKRDLSAWSGNTDHFEFVTEGNNVLLHQNANSSGSSQLSIPSTGVNGYWEFFIRLDGFNPSASNKALIYLMSDRSDLDGPVNGYLLQAGENGTEDVFRLFRVTNGVEEYEVLSGSKLIAGGGDYRVKISRSINGEWTLAVSPDYYQLPESEAIGTDNTYSTSSYFGFKTIYTSTRTDRFYFDFKIQPPPVLPLEVNKLTRLNQKELELTFNRPVDPASVTNASFLLQPGGHYPAHSETLSDTLVKLVFDRDFGQGANHLEVSGITDAQGDTVITDSSITFLNVSPLLPGVVRINEILFDPLADPDDFLPDQAEYIELYNPTEKAYSMETAFLSDAPDENFEIDALYPDNPEGKWIAPFGYFLLYAENDSEVFGESKVARFFKLDPGFETFTQRMDRATLSLSSSGDAVYLRSTDQSVIDSVHYDESWHNPNLYSTDGIALEKIHPSEASNDPTNWSSSAHPSGGTPGMQNSIYQKTGTPPDNSGLSFSPNPFSPDGDGFEDFLSISYTLNEPDYLITVRIFDRYGRLVRKLADNRPAGLEGNLTWDGLTDDRTRNRVGIYIVLLDAFDSARGKTRSFKKTVVLARNN